MTARRLHPRLLVLLLATLAALAFSALRPAEAPAQGDNVAIAINTKDGRSVFDLAFSIRRVTGDVVDQTNAAVAVSSCEECQTVALALQIVLIQSDASVITPTNLAIAMNIECSTCLTVALAYQFVLGTGERMRLTAEGQRLIAEIRRDFNELKHRDLTLEQLLAELDGLMARIQEVLDEHLVPVGPGDEERGGAEGDDRLQEPQQEPDRPPAEDQPDETAPAPTTPTEPPPDEGATQPESTTPAPSG
jgi:putative peptide zinc metalloprotease protein